MTLFSLSPATIPRRLVVVSSLALAIFIPSLASAVLKTDPVGSSVSAVFKQLNVPVEAKFRKFSAQIDFDALTSRGDQRAGAPVGE